MSIDRQQPSKNYFISIDFLLRTVLSLIAIFVIILQHVLTLCEPQSRPIDIFIYDFFTPSFGTNSWSATGLYVTCWTMIVLYIHTILLVFMDNFQIQFHATTFVIQDMITSIFFLAWTIMNVIQLSDCSKGQRAWNRNETRLQFEKPFCASVPCSIYLAPSIGSFMAMFVGISLAASAFRKINFYKIPRYIRDYDSIRSPNNNLFQPNLPSDPTISSNKQFYPLPNMDTTDRSQFESSGL